MREGFEARAESALQPPRSSRDAAHYSLLSGKDSDDLIGFTEFDASQYNPFRLNEPHEAVPYKFTVEFLIASKMLKL